jgi:hypothetical protein
MTSEYEQTHTFVICFFFGVICILFYAVEIMSVIQLFFTVTICNSLYCNVNNTGWRDSCRQLRKQLQILPLPSQYFFSMLVFVNKNRGPFLSNSEIHDINTRYNYNLHLPSTNFTLVQKGVLYSGSRIYNHLPLNIKILSNDVKRFKSALKSYLIEHTFYSLDEYYQLTAEWSWFLFFLLLLNYNINNYKILFNV